MRNITLLFLGGMLCSSISYAQKSPFTRSFTKEALVEKTYSLPNQKKADKTAKVAKAKFAARSDSKFWLPTTETDYVYDLEGEEWLENGLTTNEYDKQGNLTSYTMVSEGTKTRTLYTYDKNNKLIEKIQQEEIDGEWVNSEKSDCKYDDIVTNFVIESNMYLWDEVNEDWVRYYSHKFVITRDELKNVTKVSRLLLNPDGNSYTEDEYRTIDYDPITHKATTWTSFTAVGESPNSTFEETRRYDNIIWENTNGQIVQSDEALVIGANRIKKQIFLKMVKHTLLGRQAIKQKEI